MRVSLLGACIALVVSYAASAGQLPPEYKSIDKLQIDKITLGTSLQDFLKLHPNAERVKSADEKYGVKSYALVDEADKRGARADSFSTFMFCDDKVYMMLVHWTSKGLRDAGGSELMLGSIEKKYGKPDSRLPDGKSSRWVSPDTTNVLLIGHGDGEFTVWITATKVEKKLNELKAKQAKRKIDD